MASRPSNEYPAPLYAACASTVKHSAISSHSFWSRQRAYLYLSRLISSISTRSSGVMGPRLAFLECSPQVDITGIIGGWGSRSDNAKGQDRERDGRHRITASRRCAV